MTTTRNLLDGSATAEELYHYYHHDGLPVFYHRYWPESWRRSVRASKPSAAETGGSYWDWVAEKLQQDRKARIARVFFDLRHALDAGKLDEVRELMDRLPELRPDIVDVDELDVYSYDEPGVYFDGQTKYDTRHLCGYTFARHRLFTSDGAHVDEHFLEDVPVKKFKKLLAQMHRIFKLPQQPQ